MSDDGTRYYWFLSCPSGCTLWVESSTLTPPIDLATVFCRYHETPTPMRAFLPLDVTP